MPRTSYYLVDYENVGCDGFEGAEKLTTIITKYGQVKGLEIYTLIKKNI